MKNDMAKNEFKIFYSCSSRADVIEVREMHQIRRHFEMLMFQLNISVDLL